MTVASSINVSNIWNFCVIVSDRRYNSSVLFLNFAKSTLPGGPRRVLYLRGQTGRQERRPADYFLLSVVVTIQRPLTATDDCQVQLRLSDGGLLADQARSD